ncbi:hypothetical protein ZWY2020_000475 [Hordeum vulgare]|nr:hypothetical protein ZWY2020_000475 [Hordeum vulgare]
MERALPFPPSHCDCGRVSSVQFGVLSWLRGVSECRVRSSASPPLSSRKVLLPLASSPQPPNSSSPTPPLTLAVAPAWKGTGGGQRGADPAPQDPPRRGAGRTTDDISISSCGHRNIYTVVLLCNCQLDSSL